MKLPWAATGVVEAKVMQLMTHTEVGEGIPRATGTERPKFAFIIDAAVRKHAACMVAEVVPDGNPASAGAVGEPSGFIAARRTSQGDERTRRRVSLRGEGATRAFRAFVGLVSTFA